MKQISPHPYLVEDTCNAYLIRAGMRALAIDCGSGR